MFFQFFFEHIFRFISSLVEMTNSRLSVGGTRAEEDEREASGGDGSDIMEESSDDPDGDDPMLGCLSANAKRAKKQALTRILAHESGVAERLQGLILDMVGHPNQRKLLRKIVRTVVDEIDLEQFGGERGRVREHSRSRSRARSASPARDRRSPLKAQGISSDRDADSMQTKVLSQQNMMLTHHLTESEERCE